MPATGPAWVKSCVALPDQNMLLNMSSPGTTTAKEWILKNGWSIEEWNRDDHLDRFTTFVDPELKTNVLRTTLNKYDGDGSSQAAYNAGGGRNRQEIKVDGKSHNAWKINNGDRVHIQFQLRLDAKLSHTATSFYHLMQLKPYRSSDSSLAVFTLSISKDVLHFAFNTVDGANAKMPTQHMYPIIATRKVRDLWLTVDLYLYLPKDSAGTPSEMYVTLRDLCGHLFFSSAKTGVVAPEHEFVRIKLGQYRKFTEAAPKYNRVYLSYVSMQHLAPPRRRREDDNEVQGGTYVITPVSADENVITVTKTVTKTKTKTKPCKTSAPTSSPYPSSGGGGGGANKYVQAINAAFSMNLGSESSQDACATRAAIGEPTIAQAHAVWRAGDHCGNGRGAVWAGTPDPAMAARLWLNSPPHANIIRGASKLACGAGPTSAVCIAY